MQHIIKTALQQTFNYKTNKSIYNILVGKKSHQTFFDACSQQQLSLYHSLPLLKYPSFELFLENINEFDSEVEIALHPRFTFESMVQTFQSMQLLVQTMSNIKQQSFQFVPISQNNKIQETVKIVYNYIKENDLQSDFENELHHLFEAIFLKGPCYLHYYLQGYDEPMYTRQQVSLIEQISQQQLFEYEMNNLVAMMFELEKIEYTILSRLIIKPTLSNQTFITYTKLLENFTMENIAEQQQVKINTIEDHVLEILIKGYMSNYDDYIDDELLQQFLNFYNSHRGERLKYYKEKFDSLSYFQIKVLIVGIERGDLIVV
ncbi:helix-turn-helix domain-containing protein [Staphylococcus sp. SS251]|nr:helix-turn-helix domain-containing protein [Staphylococcus singaporensis]MBE5678782.1 helix-turn-helix domain-containing protein [Staphylococcus singaporensis]